MTEPGYVLAFFLAKFKAVLAKKTNARNELLKFFVTNIQSF